MQPAELVAALRSVGAAGLNLEDTDHVAGSLRYPDWACGVAQGCSPGRVGGRLPAASHVLVDVFLAPFFAGARGPGTQENLVADALQRANAYLEALAPTASTRSPCGRRTRCGVSFRKFAAR